MSSIPDTRLSPTAATTVAAMASNIIRMLSDEPYSETHSNGPTASGISLTISTGGADRWGAGDIIEWREDATGDIALVTTVADTTLTIRRDYLGATGASHAASAVIHKRPRFFYSNITKAINDSILQDLYPDIYAVYQTSLTPAATTENWYTIAATAEEIIRAYQKPSGTPVKLVNLNVSQPEYVDSTLSATSKAFYVSSSQDTSVDIIVQYLIAPAVADLSNGAQRVVEYGACKRLLEWESGEVVQDQSLTQSGGVAPGQNDRTAAWYAAQQDILRRRERSVLDRRYRQRRRNWKGSQHVGDFRNAGGRH